MTQARMWNGSAWVKPKFYMGGYTWKEAVDYKPAVPPTYGNVGIWGFTSSVEGWTGSTYDNAGEPYYTNGHMRQDITQSGLFSSSYAAAPYSSVKIGVGVTYRARAALTVIRRSGNDTTKPVLTLECQDAVKEVTLNPGNTGWFELITANAVTQYDNMSLNPVIKLSAGALSANSLYSVEVDWCRVEDAAGNPLQYEATPGTPAVDSWPKVWTGSRWA